jgi:hypothetical protein
MAVVQRRARQMRRRTAAGWAIGVVAVVGAIAATPVLLEGSDPAAIQSDRSSPGREVVPSPDPVVEPGPTRIDARGDTIWLPSGWYRAATPIAPQLVNPRELLSFATFPFELVPSDAVCVGDAPPAAAVAAMESDDVLAWMVEWFPAGGLTPSADAVEPRPAHFDPTGLEPRDCVAQIAPYLRSGSFLFSDQGRVFDIYVVVGEDASPERERQLYDALDSLAFVTD